LIGYINHYHPQIAEHLTKQVERSGRILLPGELPPGAIAPPHESAHAHQHGPHHTHHH
jgi:hypothetical protein